MSPTGCTGTGRSQEFQVAENCEPRYETTQVISMNYPLVSSNYYDEQNW